MQGLAVLLAIPVALVFGQAPAPEKAAEPKPVEQTTVAQTASPELVGALVTEVPGITPAQAQGAAGTLFGAAKSKLSADDFAKVAGAVPNMDGLLKAAPAAGKMGGLGAAMTTASTLSKLGLKPDQIAKMAPALVKVVQSKGGAEVGALLAGALK